MQRPRGGAVRGGVGETPWMNERISRRGLGGTAAHLGKLHGREGRKGSNHLRHAPTEANPGRLPVPISGLSVALEVPIPFVGGGAEKPLLGSESVPSVAAVAARSAVETANGGASGAVDTPGSAARFSGTNDDERIFLAERWFSSSSGGASASSGCASAALGTAGCGWERRGRRGERGENESTRLEIGSGKNPEWRDRKSVV